MRPNPPAMVAARIWRLRRTGNAAGSWPAESGWSRANLAAVGTLIVTAPSAPSVPASIITPIQAGTAPLFMYGMASTSPACDGRAALGAGARHAVHEEHQPREQHGHRTRADQ